MIWTIADIAHAAMESGKATFDRWTFPFLRKALAPYRRAPLEAVGVYR